MKIISAVQPYRHPGFLNFKMAPYEAWTRLGGRTACPHYPPRLLHGLAFRFHLPRLWGDEREARLRFVEPVSLSFDTFPDYARYEVVPFVWDLWPCYYAKMDSWMARFRVKSAIVTSSKYATYVAQRYGLLNVMYCPEAVDTADYAAGKPLTERSIDVLEFGRSNARVLKTAFPPSVRHVCTRLGGTFVYTNEQLHEAMGDAKLTIALPRSITQPEVAGDVETLTQRYWENMLSRMVMVGHAPQELVDLVGYNPVVEMGFDHAQEQILDILAHIGDYQELVDKNRATALQHGDWTARMQQVMAFLKANGYEYGVT